MNPVSPKVAAGGVSGALAVITLAILGACGVHPSAEVSVAVTTLVMSFVGWVTPDHLRSLGMRVAARDEEDDYRGKHEQP